MKNYILNFALFICLIAGSASCTNDSVLKDADQEAVQENNAFEFEDNISRYLIDGKLVNDRAEIANAAANAWNVHYDYPHNKVVISTTPATYDVYLKSDVEMYKSYVEGRNKALSEADNEPEVETIENTRSSKLQKTTNNNASASRVSKNVFLAHHDKHWAGAFYIVSESSNGRGVKDIFLSHHKARCLNVQDKGSYITSIVWSYDNEHEVYWTSNRVAISLGLDAKTTNNNTFWKVVNPTNRARHFVVHRYSGFKGASKTFTIKPKESGVIKSLNNSIGSYLLVNGEIIQSFYNY